MDADTGRIIQFPGTREKVSTKATRQIQNIDGVKYYVERHVNSPL
jgi:hypothetical protein